MKWKGFIKCRRGFLGFFGICNVADCIGILARPLESMNGFIAQLRAERKLMMMLMLMKMTDDDASNTLCCISLGCSQLAHMMII